MRRARILTAVGITHFVMALLLALTALLGGPAPASGSQLLGFTPTPTPPPRTTPSSPPELVLTKTADTASVVPGQTFTYTIHVENLGPVAATGVMMRDDVPTQLEVVDASVSQGVVTINGNLVEADVGVLGVGYGATMLLRVRVKYSVVPGTEIENVVIAWSDQTFEIISSTIVLVYGLLPESGGEGTGTLILSALLAGAGLFLAALGVRRGLRLG
jgi:uncharacterized repeat protein (TIGR01451 family)